MASVIGTMQTIRTGSGYAMTAEVVGYHMEDGRRIYEVKTKRGHTYFGPKAEKVSA